MHHLESHITKIRIASEITLGAVCLISGCSIYLLFRSNSLNIYQWCSALHLTNAIEKLRKFVWDSDISEFVKFNLPDGLYSVAYILIIDAIWYNDDRVIKYYVISIVPCVTICSEVSQYFGLVEGTFDVYDLICYMIPPIIYIIYVYNSRKFNKLES